MVHVNVEEKQTNKTFRDYFVHACTLPACILACLCITATFCMWVQLHQRWALYKAQRLSMTISVAMNKRRKRKCRRLPTWGSMRCKVTFPTSCQLVYHSDCLLMITKMPDHFFQLQVVVSADSVFPYLNKQHTERERRERKGEWERENKNERKGHYACSIIIQIYSLLISGTV